MSLRDEIEFTTLAKKPSRQAAHQSGEKQAAASSSRSQSPSSADGIECDAKNEKFLAVMETGPTAVDASVQEANLKSMGIIEDEEDGHVTRGLKQRHMAMIALGGTIGTGLFVGLGTSLASAGPLSTLLAYSFMGFLVWGLMIALGEMATLFPTSFIIHAGRFVSPGFGASLAWMYWFSWGICIPTEISATALIIGFWDVEQKISPAVWISILLVLVTFVNFAGVRWFGEVEFWMSTLKVVTVVGLIILMLVLDLGGGPTGEFIGGRYWRDPGPMAQFLWTRGADGAPEGGISGSWGRFLAFWSVLVSASFAFAGTEIVGICVGEVEAPRKNVPKAIKRVAYRIGLFYVLAVLFVGLCVPYTDDRLLTDSSTASASPYVIAIESARIKFLPNLINAVLVVVTWSAAQADLYAASRALYALALEGRAPRIFRKCTKAGLPFWSLVATSLWGPLAYLGIGSIGAEKAFGYLYDLSAVSILVCWWAILITYCRFHRGLGLQGLARSDLPYIAPLQPYLSWFVVLIFSIIILLAGFQVFMRGLWAADTFVTTYLPVIVFPIVWVGYDLWQGTRVVSYREMDLQSGRREIDELEEFAALNYKPDSVSERILNWLF
ncbi:hypothetical protein IE81DRAFT_319518 [Ceraceosorus guamensis]|uniref:Amino acid permease/ SLC12A domain-containing protein n=1 Tax=Ceraceosorus guamensis TaxID=1522189 RepID=A0A316W888_9BASI|nr:hypothetical protein IE81DRAFT_319518 [Ceraceosorus guamensis]PWN46136.1 hypothetical protein IE81DRAFT_319518 [Ceraceosorus guamensis]